MVEGKLKIMGKKKKERCYVQAPAFHDEGNHYVLLIHTNKKVIFHLMFYASFKFKMSLTLSGCIQSMRHSDFFFSSIEINIFAQ